MKQNKTDKFVKCVANKKFLKAKDVLEAIIKEKIDSRVADVLSTQNQKENH